MDDNNTTMMEAQAASTAVLELVTDLEQATLSARKLPATSDPTQLLQLYAALHQAHHRLSSFLSNTQFAIPTVSETSLSSANATAGGAGDHEPMQLEDEDEPEASIDKVEERLRDCFIRNKRAKRRLSPSSAAALEERRVGGNGSEPADTTTAHDSHTEKLRAFDLIYQFHG